MKKIISKCLHFSMLSALSTLLLSGCSDWTEYESLDLTTPSVDAGLQADYVRNLKTYKAGAHKVMFVSLENPATGPTRQAERLTALPDSLDFISLNNPDNLSAAYVDEMNAVREKGTKVVYMIDFATFETEWTELQKADPSQTEENAQDYIASRTQEMLTLYDKYRYDGVIFVYGGRSMASMTEEDLVRYGGRQTAFFDAVSAWHGTHGDAGLSYKGQAQYLLDANKVILSDCDYIILETTSASNASALTIAASAALASGNVPSDRFVITVETTRYDDEDMIYGYFGQVDAAGNAVRSIEGAAVWMGQPSEFVRAGMLILNAQYDYYDNVPTYFHLREAIDIMNPSPKK